MQRQMPILIALRGFWQRKHTYGSWFAGSSEQAQVLAGQAWHGLKHLLAPLDSLLWQLLG